MLTAQKFGLGWIFGLLYILFGLLYGLFGLHFELLGLFTGIFFKWVLKKSVHLPVYHSWLVNPPGGGLLNLVNPVLFCAHAAG